MFLDDDNLPRIRNGIFLDSLYATVTHFTNLETVSCEAVKSSDENTFDSLQWFTADTKKVLSYQFSTIQIDDEIFNYTSLFPNNSNLIKNNTNYQCCTVLKGEIVHCQQFLSIIYSPPETTTTKRATLASKKSLTDKNISTLKSKPNVGKSNNSTVIMGDLSRIDAIQVSTNMGVAAAIDSASTTRKSNLNLVKTFS